jgi:hypothetical protein
VLAICGTQPILSPVIAAFLFEVIKIYRPFSNAWFSKYEGVFFGLGALAVAVIPGMRLSFAGRRTAARDGRSPVTTRARLAIPPPVRVSSQGSHP